MGLEFVVSIRGLMDSLLQGRVGVVPGAPHVIGTLGDQVVHIRTQALRGRARACNEESKIPCRVKNCMEKTLPPPF